MGGARGRGEGPAAGRRGQPREAGPRPGVCEAGRAQRAVRFAGPGARAPGLEQRAAGERGRRRGRSTKCVPGACESSVKERVRDRRGATVIAAGGFPPSP